MLRVLLKTGKDNKRTVWNSNEVVCPVCISYAMKRCKMKQGEPESNNNESGPDGEKNEGLPRKLGSGVVAAELMLPR